MTTPSIEVCRIIRRGVKSTPASLFSGNGVLRAETCMVSEARVNVLFALAMTPLVLACVLAIHIAIVTAVTVDYTYAVVTIVDGTTCTVIVHSMSSDSLYIIIIREGGSVCR